MYKFPYVFETSNYEQDVAWWGDGWSYDEVQKIIQVGEALPKQQGMAGSRVEVNNELKSVRDSQISWIHASDETKWIFDKLYKQIRVINSQYFGFELTAFEDGLQYSTYEFKNDSPLGGEHYDWHIDMLGKSERGCRKLSFSLSLSSPQEFEGGDLIVRGLRHNITPKEKGRLIVFPSYAVHKVTPVTQGLRRTLVGWVVGPQFR